MRSYTCLSFKNPFYLELLVSLLVVFARRLSANGESSSQIHDSSQPFQFLQVKVRAPLLCNAAHVRKVEAAKLLSPHTIPVLKTIASATPRRLFRCARAPRSSMIMSPRPKTSTRCTLFNWFLAGWRTLPDELKLEVLRCTVPTHEAYDSQNFEAPKKDV
jgi:hypothetical protein